MNGITHKQARRYMFADLDGLLTNAQRHALQTHLAGCETCRAESQSLSLLTTRLQSEFHSRWDAHDGPSKNVMTKIHSQTRRIIMFNKVNLGVRAIAGIVALIMVGVVLNVLIPQLQEASVATSETQVNNSLPETHLPERLIAFTSDKDGNAEIYTVYPDGSGMTNLTNNSAYDANPIWSPDGMHIAFESDRTGIQKIYMMDADGSNVTQLTSDSADHHLPLNIDGSSNPWSPDGSKLLFLALQQNSDPSDQVSILRSRLIKSDSWETIATSTSRFSFNSISWSPDGKHIGYVLNESSNETDFQPVLYIVDADGSNPRNLKNMISKDDEYLDSKYYWATDGRSMIFTTTKNDPLRQVVYEFSLDTNAVLQRDVLQPEILDWRGDVSLVMSAEQPEATLVWQRQDGTENALKLGAVPCWSLDVTRSQRGNFAVGASCPDNKFQLFWANSDGSTIKQLLDFSPGTGIDGQADITWSPDDRYVAFNVATSQKTEMYILDIEEALNDPAIQPMIIPVSDREFYAIPSWQPVVKNKVVEEKPTPEPLSFNLTVAEAETLGGFDILEPSYLPVGFELEGVSFESSTQQVAMQYRIPGELGVLYIYQRRGKLTHDPSVSAYVTPVSIGENEGEYSRGAWVYESPNTTVPTWEAGADVYFLSWQLGEFVLSINFLGGETITPLSRDVLIKIAESMK